MNALLTVASTLASDCFITPGDDPENWVVEFARQTDCLAVPFLFVISREELFVGVIELITYCTRRRLDSGDRSVSHPSPRRKKGYQTPRNRSLQRCERFAQASVRRAGPGSTSFH